MANSDLVQSVAKALDLLSFAAERPEGFRVSEAAEHFGMKAPAVHNLLRTMIHKGYLVKNDLALYRVGPAAGQLARSARGQDALEDAERVLRTICSEYPDSTLTITEFTHRGLICRRRLSPELPGQMQMPYKRIIPVYHSVTGCAAMIFSEVPPEVLERRWPFAEYAFPDWECREEFEEFAAECRLKGCVEGGRAGIFLAAFPFKSELFIGVRAEASGDDARCLLYRVREIISEAL